EGARVVGDVRALDVQVRRAAGAHDADRLHAGEHADAARRDVGRVVDVVVVPVDALRGAAPGGVAGAGGRRGGAGVEGPVVGVARGAHAGVAGGARRDLAGGGGGA